ncbi:cytochrome C oxidase subunit IV family protein [Brevibacillus porteri]|uniref:Cytochrome C oxidase subunit IV n=2 Tax=Brevibacillus TaxID=55080 RepID=A0A517IFR1_BREBE|nr:MULTISPECIES: cytochrome C oxidase subunit IV family protein [Brevibacillus]MED1799424.1 cytochrome C oxidase subunit IV family protein [Brevibacillus porteri]MED2131898.1 cytochrome C oxidase subunit IV family protein [Brevibacillus porteri]MED2742780.1 cytochrome C oxidase subunit IV family protein [Brevibacillus porteri]MED2817884.1 cytochrome C oxidase subunit IV family protein [Brevibacillus porteri]MED2893187.1 cytochrome C oxidase subunit IV family protein [Brevibacillus porteri]
MGAQAHNEEVRKPKVKHEGPKRHLVAFIGSLVLTALAFIAVAYEAIPSGFTVPFIVALAFVQAFFQLYVWMHMDQKGHEFARISIFAGLFVILLAIFVFIFWVWV